MEKIHNIEKQQISVFKADSGPYYICMSRGPHSRIFHLQNACWSEVRFVKAWDGSGADLQSIQDALKMHHLRGFWYCPSPEVETVIRRQGVGLPPPLKRGGRKLTKEQVGEIFRWVHDSSTSHQIIGEHYGVSTLTVGKIGRAECHPDLLWRSPVDEHGIYYVSERAPGSPRYQYQIGRRKTK